jgi:hypothetical protein
MSLEYDSNNETLSVTITHTSGNFFTHYIFEVTVNVNGGQVVNESYSSQPSNSFTIDYNVTASDGDSIEVTALCTQAGTITRSITVGQTTGAISGYVGLWLIMGVSTIILVVIINKKLRK